MPAVRNGLDLSHAPVARPSASHSPTDQRGRPRQQIKDDLVDRFGPAVLALPEEKGFSLAAYLVPLLVALGAAAAVLVAVRRWSRRPADPPPAAVVDAADRRRLEGELAAYDRGSPAPSPSPPIAARSGPDRKQAIRGNWVP